MGELNSPVPTKCWIKFLTYKGCGQSRIEASHHIWKCPNSIRPIVFRGNKKEIPRFHINTNLKSLNISSIEFNVWIKENC
jgi:predicted RNA binding protein YcfA (HicA-like mRNA interferase family)